TELVLNVVLRRSPCVRAVVAVIASATIIIPVVAGGAGAAPATENTDAVRPFHINIPEAALADLRQRVLATRWPDRETVSDRSQGVQLAKLQALVSYWGTGYDWRKVEAKLDALPQFVTKINGLDIHFIHVPTALRARGRC
ncbi:MAG TPA: epoxide hydrolase N-terminal domain-containing protein, partial [Chthoniobacterales bacterium]